MQLTLEFKEQAREAVLEARTKYSGSDAAFAKTLGLNASVFSRIKSGETENILSDSNWLQLGREFNIALRKTKWNITRTEVYIQIEDNLKFCKEFSKAMILVDQWGIGKTASAKHIVKNMTDAFYLDCSQAKNKSLFIRSLAKAVGIDSRGRYVDVKQNLKYYLNDHLQHPIVVLDDAGDLDYQAFLELKELWNGTEDNCGWYIIGDDSLQKKITKGIQNQKVGYGAIFSRFSDKFISLVPIDRNRKQAFMTKLVGDVATANTNNQKQIPDLVKRCVSQEKTLRHLKTLIQMSA